MNLASIPSPSDGVWNIGFFPLRGYALCIILGVVAAVLIGERRYVNRGGESGAVGDIAIWAVPFGLVGGRLYHVMTDPELYFAAGKDPINALYIWRGGLGIWGAVALGALGAYIGCRRRGIKFRPMADALAPGIVVAQAIGRWGNWFNQELYGRPTTLPWGLEIDPAHRTSLPAKYQEFDTFHPAFLYEAIWDVGVAIVVIWLDRRLRLGWGRAFALYVMCYTAGRGWIEYLRIDTANDIFGVRVNVWTSIVLFIAATAYFVIVGRRHPGRETSLVYGDDDADAAVGSSGPGGAAPADVAGGSSGHEGASPADAAASSSGHGGAAPADVAAGSSGHGGASPAEPGAGSSGHGGAAPADVAAGSSGHGEASPAEAAARSSRHEGAAPADAVVAPTPDDASSSDTERSPGSGDGGSTAASDHRSSDPPKPVGP